MKYFFIPGHEFELSLAELENFLRYKNINYKKDFIDQDIFIVDISGSSTKDINRIFPLLGGFVKFGLIINDPYAYIEDYLERKNLYLTSEQNPTQTDSLPITKSNRVNFSISLIGKENDIRPLVSKRNKLGMDFKKYLKEKGYKARFVCDSRSPSTSTVLIAKNNVLPNGFELNLIVDPKNRTKTWAVTLAIQDFEDFAKRDYGRPRSNKNKGMLPPKLARIMINLSRDSNSNNSTEEKDLLWDPFCGSGTILSEALLLGYQVVGSDIDNMAIEESEENLEWISSEYNILQTMFSLFQQDVKDNLQQKINPTAIIAEPYMGPPLRTILRKAEVDPIINQINTIYNSLQERINEISNSGRLVIIVPSFKTDKGWLDMPFTLIKNSKLIDITNQISPKPLQWERQHSIIRRNIMIFKY